MKKNVAVMMNTDKLGGAERSLLLQLTMVNEHNFTFYIPNINGCRDIENYVRTQNLGSVTYYEFPKSVYSISRTNIVLSIFSFLDLLKYLFFIGPLGNIFQSDYVYLNGNKVAFLFFWINLLRGFRGKVIWHLRDYYYQSRIGDYIWRILLKNLGKKLTIVCNSFSVLSQLEGCPLEKYTKKVIYNPSGLSAINTKSIKFENIGFVSMLAPWKGVHEMVFFAWLYEEELRTIGIKKIAIYGDNLYETRGEHLNYKEDLKNMLNKFPSTLIKFEGMQSPEKIFSEIDCLVHYSLRPEPFGRVIVEAYDSFVPVITTGLGGAGELVENCKTGLKVIPYDRQDLFEKIQRFATDTKFKEATVSNAKEKALELQKEIKRSMQNIFAD